MNLEQFLEHVAKAEIILVTPTNGPSLKISKAEATKWGREACNPDRPFADDPVFVRVGSCSAMVSLGCPSSLGERLFQ